MLYDSTFILWYSIAHSINYKAFVDSAGMKSANMEDKFLFSVLAAFSITWMERKATKFRHVLLIVVREIK